MPEQTITEHRPVQLTGFTGLCATGDCDHDTDMGPDGCQEVTQTACEACTITDPDADAVRIVAWPCEHAFTADNPEVQHFIFLHGGLRGHTIAKATAETGYRIVREIGAPWDPMGPDTPGSPAWYRVSEEIADAWDADDDADLAGQDMHNLLVRLGRTVSMPAELHDRLIRATEAWRRETGRDPKSTTPTP